jgi:hypothetical protein
MRIRTDKLPWPVAPRLVTILQEEMTKGNHVEGDCIISFRDHSYSPERGGYHPVEIAVNEEGGIDYITDFSYVGAPPMCELAKEIDFDFSLNILGHFGVDFPLREGKELFKIWQSNFVAYYDEGVFTTRITDG